MAKDSFIGRTFILRNCFSCSRFVHLTAPQDEEGKYCRRLVVTTHMSNPDLPPLLQFIDSLQSKRLTKMDSYPFYKLDKPSNSDTYPLTYGEFINGINSWIQSEGKGMPINPSEWLVFPLKLNVPQGGDIKSLPDVKVYKQEGNEVRDIPIQQWNHHFRIGTMLSCEFDVAIAAKFKVYYRRMRALKYNDDGCADYIGKVSYTSPLSIPEQRVMNSTQFLAMLAQNRAQELPSGGFGILDAEELEAQAMSELED